MDPLEFAFFAFLGALVLLGQVFNYFTLRRILVSTTSAQQALADLTAAVTSLQGAVTSLQTADTALDTAIATLLAAQQAGTGVDPAAVEALVAQLQTASNALGPVVTDLTNQTATINAPPPAKPALVK